VATEAHQLLGELRDRQRAVDDACLHRAARHLHELRRCGLLRERDAVLGLDGPQPLRSVRTGSREDDADRVAATLLGQ
jgi:hypothetical protein